MWRWKRAILWVSLKADNIIFNIGCPALTTPVSCLSSSAAFVQAAEKLVILRACCEYSLLIALRYFIAWLVLVDDPCA